MHTPTRSHDNAIARRALLVGTVLLAGTVMGTAPAGADPTHSATGFHAREHATGFHARERVRTTGGPALVHGPVADLLVRVRGGALCSGTPIRDTLYVVTAAHCVLGEDGTAEARTVVRDGVTYPVAAVLVDGRYVEGRKVQLDAAVLVLDHALPGASATVGTATPARGSVTIAGFQALDSDGTLLRGTSPHEVLLPKGATGDLVRIESAPAGCVVPTASLSIAAGRVDVACGLIPGASGGGLFATAGDTIQLVGIVSTVSSDVSSNGVVPLSSLDELLAHPQRYWHDVTVSRAGRPTHVIRS
jgi:hypothetical protein